MWEEGLKEKIVVIANTIQIILIVLNVKILMSGRMKIKLKNILTIYKIKEYTITKGVK